MPLDLLADVIPGCPLSQTKPPVAPAKPDVTTFQKPVSCRVVKLNRFVALVLNPSFDEIK